jgi:exopolyphosphatase/guanosine-5'-triphosphate,3'-diphosphate pyrophosphatase
VLKAGDWRALKFEGLRADRAPVLAGGLAIMSAIMSELDITRMNVAAGAMREGILHDLLGRFQHQDQREATVEEFMRRYHVDHEQAKRVSALALELLAQLGSPVDGTHLRWAAMLHEIGISVSHSGYHKHSAYIIQNADMPGFSRSDQQMLAGLVLGHRGSLKKMLNLPGEIARPLAALRVAALIYRSRRAFELPPIYLSLRKQRFELKLDEAWFEANPLTAAALAAEASEWENANFELRVVSTREPKQFLA